MTDYDIAELARLAAEKPVETDDLYHYTSASVALDSVLAQMQFRLGLLEATNDPRGSRPRYPNLSGAHGVPNESTDLQKIWKLLTPSCADPRRSGVSRATTHCRIGRSSRDGYGATPIRRCGLITEERTVGSA